MTKKLIKLILRANLSICQILVDAVNRKWTKMSWRRLKWSEKPGKKSGSKRRKWRINLYRNEWSLIKVWISKIVWLYCEVYERKESDIFSSSKLEVSLNKPIKMLAERWEWLRDSHERFDLVWGRRREVVRFDGRSMVDR